MKYLQRFNESFDENFTEELKDFCETNLAYLLDEAELRIIENPGGYQDLTLIRIKLNQSKTWVEIKDHMIPFLTRLKNKYQISSKVWSALNSMILAKCRRKSFSSHLSININHHELNFNRYDHKCGDIRFYIGVNTDEIYPNESYVETSIESLINDEPNSVSTTKLYRYSLDDIRIYIKKQQPKKGILTKIKSFFK